MDPTRWKQIDEIVDAALELPEAEWEAFVTTRSGDDEELRNEVLRLLSAQKPSEQFLNHSAMRTAAAALAAESRPTQYRFLDKQIAQYKIEKLLGAGGMGEVYLALDEKLHRRVALKVLPPEFISNDERVKRFELEARAISKLNHPNIVTIYDVGNFEGVNYIATEYVEGKNLRELMGRDFKLRNILLNSIQICDALSAAHEAGIIHRDIKPENIMIRRDGYAKILDFGLAKLSDTDGHDRGSIANTMKGTLIGTPAYMSPEQISDDPVDHRTDLWSCGVVLYEFLTGTNPFKKATRQATLQSIIAETPPPASELNPQIPAELERILIKALEKDPDVSYQSAAELRADLKRVLREVDSSPSAGFSSSSSRQDPAKVRNSQLPIFIGLVVVFVAIGIAWYSFSRQKATTEVTDWKLATMVQLSNDPGTEYFPSLSPDGRSFIYVSREGGDWDVMLQRIGGSNPQNLTADSPATDTQPAFSPDGEYIAFRSERDEEGIYVIGATGENPKRILDFGFHPAWSPDGKFLAVSTFGRDIPDTRNPKPSEIWIVNVNSGEKRKLTDLDAMQPAWSPDGKFIAFWFMPQASGRRDVAVIPVEGGEPVVVTADGTTNWNPVWSRDGSFLYFASDQSGSMTFRRIAMKEGRPAGEPEAVIAPSKFSRHLSFSGDGRKLIYVSTDNRSNIRGVKLKKGTMKPDGEPFWITKGDRQVSRPDLSPDGSRFVFRLPRRAQEDIVTIEANGSNPRDVTNDEAFDRYPRWSPDGRQIAFTSDRNGSYDVYSVNADGTGLRRITFDGAGATFPLWSPDGTRLLYRANRKLFIVDLTRPLENQAHVAIPDYQGSPSRFVAWDWSRDGDKLAGTFSGNPMRVGFFSFSTGQFVSLAETTQFPRWLPDSRRILFGNAGSISVIDIETRSVTEILRTDGEISDLGISDDGDLLYYVVNEEESDIWMLDLSGPK